MNLYKFIVRGISNILFIVASSSSFIRYPFLNVKRTTQKHGYMFLCRPLVVPSRLIFIYIYYTTIYVYLLVFIAIHIIFRFLLF
nr:MAG TPA: hypothetical protein [Caudoviricetes sp.]